MAIVTGRTNGDTGGGGTTTPAGQPDGDGEIPGQRHADGAAPGRPGGPRQRARPLSEAGRVRQPVALIRLLTGLITIALTLLLADYARATTGGIAADVAEAAALVPRPLANLAGGLTTAAVLLLPVGLAVRRLLGPDRRRALQQVSDGLLAAVIAYGATLALGLWADDLAPASLLTALTQRLPADALAHTEPVYGYLAPVLAFMTASASRERRLPWAVLTLSGLAGLAGGYATPTALLLGLLIGWTGAHGTLYAVGTPDPRPRPGEVLRALRDSGLRPVEALPAGPDHYQVRQADDRPELDVQLLDRQAVTAAAVQRAWRRLRLRTAPHPRALRSPRTGLEHEALVTYAALAAGVRTRRIAATAGLGHDTALIAYEHLAGRTLDQLDDEEITDGLLTDAWGQLALLQRREIAHRALVPSSLLVDGGGAVHLVDFADGDIAASELVLRCDVVQLLTTLALRAGAARAVRTATTVLGRDALGAALPLLQPIALARSTRQALKRRPDGSTPGAGAGAGAGAGVQAGTAGGLLEEIRAEVSRGRPEVVGRPVRLERLRPRTLFAVAGGVVAGVLLIPQFFAVEDNPVAALTDADPWWLALAVLAAGLSHVAAAMGFVGFVPERLNFRNVVLAQVAGAFVKLVSPGGVGGIALNTRLLQRADIPTAQALSSVGVGQLIGLVLHLLQLGAFVYLVDAQPGGSELAALPAVVCGLVVATVLLVVVWSIPPARRWLAARLRPLTAEVLPRLLDLLRNPGRLAVGVAGQLLVSLCLITCLYCCALAIGRAPSFAAVAVVFLVGNAAGNAAPTPGGVGAVDGALLLGLQQTASMEEGGALAAVALFRLLTLILPVLPGWAAMTWLQRRKAL
ncbi:lysylphosphatidylglycerol synthase transmembrane domain-containing protein [Kitasatospora sp. NPDC028055]|uniref:lysylphosphatidylglycerol synthase transmembrane domain-containing protein n=1 Tax=Kitasatospora sp. NPDC028055 TaxID=3155653 RepID=UPI003411ACBF